MSYSGIRKTPLENSLYTALSWKNFSQWVHCICVVTFDLELGQALEHIYPKHINLTKQEVSNICYLAFPDSNSGCMGDTHFIIRLPRGTVKSELSKEHQKYNSECFMPLQIDTGFYWGYVYFRQVKNSSLPRGYFQKSVVILSRFPFYRLFGKISCLISPEYFENGEPSLEAACHNINKWPLPVPGDTVSLPIMGSVFQVYIPHNNNSTSPKQSIKDILLPLESRIQIPSVEDFNLFEILQPVLSHIHLLWELVLTSEPLVVMASSPTHCSSMVVALTRIISPLKFCADFRPYFTIHDSEFKQFTSKSRNPPPVILGVTNPFFAKTLHHWPHTIQLSEDSDQSQKFTLKKTNNGNSKVLDINPGVYTPYKCFLQKDKTIIKNLLLGINSKRPMEVQSALLKRHLLELTQSFIIPLERYMASLMPLLRNISPYKAAPHPLPFNPDDFFATLETTGPHLTSGIKGDWVGLYKKFFRSQNFNGWFNTKYTKLVLKLQALQLEALSDADLKLWVQGKPEVEVVDMVLKIKSKITKCRECVIPISDTTTEQLEQQLHDILSILPDDIKHILHVT